MGILRKLIRRISILLSTVLTISTCLTPKIGIVYAEENLSTDFYNKCSELIKENWKEDYGLERKSVDSEFQTMRLIIKSKNNNIYMSGTSMAAPHISATIAMYKLENPSLNVSQLESLLKSNTKDLGDKGWDKYYGYGQPKLSKLINNNLITINDIKGHWAELSINNFINQGYINGYEDGTFTPNNSITRAEFIKIFNKYFGLTKKSGKSFNDTSSHWAKDEIDIAVTNGIVNGFEDNTFRPNEPISREQAAKVISNYKKLSDNNFDKINKYKDSNSVSSWAKSSVEGVLEEGYMNGYEDNTFKPKNNITRAEAVVILSRVEK